MGQDTRRLSRRIATAARDEDLMKNLFPAALPALAQGPISLQLRHSRPRRIVWGARVLSPRMFSCILSVMRGSVPEPVREILPASRKHRLGVAQWGRTQSHFRS